MATVNKINLRVVTRLIEAGFTTEKAITDLSIADAVDIPGITVAEMKAITGLQKAIRGKRLVSFFVEDEEEHNGECNT